MLLYNDIIYKIIIKNLLTKKMFIKFEHIENVKTK